MTQALQIARLGARTLFRLQRALTKGDADAIVEAEPAARECLRWHCRHLQHWVEKGAPIFDSQAKATVRVIADGSPVGFGARFTIDEEVEDLDLKPRPGDEEVSGEWTDGEADEAQFMREAHTLLKVLQRKAHRVRRRNCVSLYGLCAAQELH
jgi:hypothetical protein